MLPLLLLALAGPYVVWTGLGRIVPRLRTSRRVRMKAGITLLFLVTASGHFLQTAAMVEMLPPWVPFRVAIIYVTGVFELLGAIGIWVPAVERMTGACLILMLLGVLPSNVYAAFHHVPFGGHDAGPLYLLVRVPFQFLLIGVIYWATLRGRRSHDALRTRKDPTSTPASAQANAATRHGAGRAGVGSTR